jgi:hypothetical protein
MIGNRTLEPQDEINAIIKILSAAHCFLRLLRIVPEIWIFRARVQLRQFLLR